MRLATLRLATLRRTLARAVIALTLLTAPWLTHPARAQSTTAFPTRAIRVIVPFPAGGISDVLARALGVQLASRLGQPVIIDNRPGAGTTIAAEQVARAAPDGYTLLMQDIATHALNATLYRNLGYDTLRDFSAVALVAASPLVLVVNPEANVPSVASLITAARSAGDRMSYGSSGNGTLPHLVGEAFKSQASLATTHVPYKGQTAQHVLSGEVAWTFSVMPPAVAAAKGGKLRALAVTSTQRVGALPGVPTMAEAGVSGFEFMLPSGLLGPAAMPRAVIARIHAEVTMALGTPELQATLATIGAEPSPMSPEASAGFIARETERLGRLARQSGTQLD